MQQQLVLAIEPDHRQAAIVKRMDALYLNLYGMREAIKAIPTLPKISPVPLRQGHQNEDQT